MGFFNFVKQHNAVGAAAHGLGQLPALLVSDIAGRCADQPCHGVPLHIFGHIQAQQGFFAAKPAGCQGARQLGLAHAGGSQKQQRPDGLARLAQTGAAAAYGGGNGGNSAGLPDHAFVQALFQQAQPLPLGFVDAVGGYAARLADDVGDIALGQNALAFAAGVGDALGGGSLVQQVNGFVGQKAPRQIPHA